MGDRGTPPHREQAHQCKCKAEPPDGHTRRCRPLSPTAGARWRVIDPFGEVKAAPIKPPQATIVAASAPRRKKYEPRAPDRSRITAAAEPMHAVAKRTIPSAAKMALAVFGRPFHAVVAIKSLTKLWDKE